jgi:exodeoxyribonuclease VII small subunit
MANKEKKTYQELKRELESILEQLQHEDTDIDKAVELHKKGQKTLKQLEEYLGKVGKEMES